MTDHNDRLNKVQQDLISSEDNLSSREIFRLQQARNKALSQQDFVRSNTLSFWPSLSAILASSLLLAVFFLEGSMDQLQQDNDRYNSIIDLAAYLSEDDDELDVYYWLAESEEDLDMLYGYISD